jgi:hypothetical protein
MALPPRHTWAKSFRIIGAAKQWMLNCAKTTLKLRLQYYL